MSRRLLAALVLSAAPALAQSPDPAFLGRWTWSPNTLVSEGTGLGGAFVATARGSDALFWSPAALTFDSGLDLRASMGERSGFGVVRHGETLHLGFGVRRTYARSERGGGFDESQDVFEVGRLSVRVDQAALGAGVRVGRLRLGMSALAGPLRVDGAWSRVSGPSSAGEAEETRYDYADLGEWQIGAAGGAIVEVLQIHPMARTQLRVGAAVQWPTLVRTASYGRSRLRVGAGGTPFEGEGPDRHAFGLPRTASVGAEARLSVFSSVLRNLRVAVGADWADYSRVLEAVRDNEEGTGAPLTFDEGRDWRLGGGLEGVLPMGRLRVGVREPPSHRLVSERRGPREEGVVFSVGASRDEVIGGKRLQFDLDATHSFDDVLLSGRLLW